MEIEAYTRLEDAIAMGKKYPPKVKHSRVPVLEAVGKYSMEEIRAPDDFPRKDRSAMDGYALDSKETISASKTNPAVFDIVGELFPSSKATRKVKEGEAVKVMTGAPMPEGTDAVVMMEDTEEYESKLKVFSPVRRFQNVSRKGEDIRKNFRIVRRGERITPPHVAALYEIGVGEIKVCSLSIGILSTGDEIVSGDVKNTTQPLLISYFRIRGFQANGYGAVEDDLDKIKGKLDGMREDVIIVTGGTGPGERDYLPYLVEREGRFIFRGLRIRPGRTTSLALIKGRPVFVLSGLPVAALIASENLIMRIVEGWFNLSREVREIREGVLQRSIVNTLGFRSFVRVKIDESGGMTKVFPTRVTGSGVIYSVIDADGIVSLDENVEGLEEGEKVKVEMLRW